MLSPTTLRYALENRRQASGYMTELMDRVPVASPYVLDASGNPGYCTVEVAVSGVIAASALDIASLHGLTEKPGPSEPLDRSRARFLGSLTTHYLSASRAYADGQGPRVQSQGCSDRQAFINDRADDPATPYDANDPFLCKAIILGRAAIDEMGHVDLFTDTFNALPDAVGCMERAQLKVTDDQLDMLGDLVGELFVAPLATELYDLGADVPEKILAAYRRLGRYSTHLTLLGSTANDLSLARITPITAPLLAGSGFTYSELQDARSSYLTDILEQAILPSGNLSSKPVKIYDAIRQLIRYTLKSSIRADEERLRMMFKQTQRISVAMLLSS